MVFCPVATHCTDVPGSIECDTSRMRWRSKSRGRPQLNFSCFEPVSSLAVVGRVLREQFRVKVKLWQFLGNYWLRVDYYY